MARRKQAKPSRPSGSTVPTNGEVTDQLVQNEERGELAAVLEDAEELPDVLIGKDQAVPETTPTNGRFKNTSGYSWS